MEPPDPDVPGRRPRTARIIERLSGLASRAPLPRGPELRLGVLAAASALALFSRGDVFVLAALLAAASLVPMAGIGSVLALAALVVRLGSSSLAAPAGVQAVFGPLAFVGPPAAALSAWCAAGALVLAAPSGVAAVPFGLAAGLVLAGPSTGSLAGSVVRLLAALAMVDLALTVPHRIGRHRAHLAAAGLGGAALVFGWWGRAPGRWRWDAVLSWRLTIETTAAALVIGVLVAVGAALVSHDRRGSDVAEREPA